MRCGALLARRRPRSSGEAHADGWRRRCSGVRGAAGRDRPGALRRPRPVAGGAAGHGDHARALGHRGQRARSRVRAAAARSCSRPGAGAHVSSPLRAAAEDRAAPRSPRWRGRGRRRRSDARSAPRRTSALRRARFGARRRGGRGPTRSLPARCSMAIRHCAPTRRTIAGACAAPLRRSSADRGVGSALVVVADEHGGPTALHVPRADGGACRTGCEAWRVESRYAARRRTTIRPRSRARRSTPAARRASCAGDADLDADLRAGSPAAAGGRSPGSSRTDVRASPRALSRLGPRRVERVRDGRGRSPALRNGAGRLQPPTAASTRLGSAAGERPPMPWVNVIANETFGCLVSESGAALHVEPQQPRAPADAVVQRPRARPARRGSLRPRRGQPAPSGRHCPGPRPPAPRYEVRHGFGYTMWRHRSHGARAGRSTVFVPRHDPVQHRARAARPTSSPRPRRLSVFAYQRLVLWALAAESDRCVVTRDVARARSVAGAQPRSPTSSATVWPSPPQDRTGAAAACVTADRSRVHRPQRQLARARRRCCAAARPRWHAAARALDPCFALQIDLELAAGRDGRVRVPARRGSGRRRRAQTIVDR